MLDMHTSGTVEVVERLLRWCTSIKQAPSAPKISQK